MEKIKVIDAEGVEKEIEVAKVFKTEAELENALKSENSKGKGEILKTLGVTSVEEAKTKMNAAETGKTEVEKLTTTVNNLTARLENEEHLRLANELGVKPELAGKVIILAKASMSEGKDFKTVLEAEAKAIGAIKGTQKDTPAVIGAPKTKEEIELANKEREEMQRLRDLDPGNPR